MSDFPAKDNSYPIVFLIHPSEGFEQREAFIAKQLTPIGLKYITIDECDAGSETLKSRRKEWFKDNMLAVGDNIRSCTAKHLTAYLKVLELKCDGALILEDDIKISRKFPDILRKSISELNNTPEYNGKAVIISFENTRLRFVEHSRRKKGQLLYKGDRDRMAGAYYINGSACRLMIDLAKKEKFSDPIDIEHKKALDKGMLYYLWCHPTVASQGSFDGTFETSLGKRKKFVFLKWHLKLLYHKLLYYFR